MRDRLHLTLLRYELAFSPCERPCRRVYSGCSNAFYTLAQLEARMARLQQAFAAFEESLPILCAACLGHRACVGGTNWRWPKSRVGRGAKLGIVAAPRLS